MALTAQLGQQRVERAGGLVRVIVPVTVVDGVGATVVTGEARGAVNPGNPDAEAFMTAQVKAEVEWLLAQGQEQEVAEAQFAAVRDAVDAAVNGG